MEFSNAFTVDVEDYFHVSTFEKQISRDDWDRFDCRVVRNTHRILELLDRHGVRATFFVLGWVGQRYPELVRRIFNAGHEVGCHGYWHRLIYRQTPDQFRDDLRQSRDLLQDAIGQPVTAYRAPTFSITKKSLWALDVLAEEGFRFDSSIFPIRHDRYGIPGAEPAPYRIATNGCFLWEFPCSVLSFAGLNVPVSGGGYFRLYPIRWTIRFLKNVNRKLGRPFVFYIHPWELDPEQPRLKTGSWISRRRHYLNLEWTEAKLELLLQSFRFGRLSDVIGQLRIPDACPLAKPSAETRQQDSGPAQPGGADEQSEAKIQIASCCKSCPCRSRNGRRDSGSCTAPVFELAFER